MGSLLKVSGWQRLVRELYTQTYCQSGGGGGLVVVVAVV